MKKMFTKLFGAAMLSALLLSGAVVNAQTTYASTELMTKKDGKDVAAVAATTTPAPKPADVDTAWHPQRRLWGYAFGDAYYAQHAPALTSTQGKENNYYQTPKDRNAFQFRRMYLGYDYEITKKFKVQVLLASEPSETTAPNTVTPAGGVPTNVTNAVNGDNLADGKMAFYIKNFNLRVREVWSGADLVIGEMATPGFSLNEAGTNAPTTLAESTWGYRSIEKTITDFHKNNSFDVGAAIQGTFDVSTKNFGYVVMVGDNTSASNTTVYNPNSALSASNPNPGSGFLKIFYGDLWGKFFDQHLYLDVYADYARTSSTVTSAAVTAGSIAPLEHNMFKVFAAYTMPKLTIGVEAYTQNLDNALVNNTTKTAEKGTVNGFSAFVRGPIVKGKWGYFARFDSYNPDTKFTKADSYSVTSNGAYSSYDPSVKEQFYTFGLDYTPAKNVHFEPNVWLTRYNGQYNPGVAGYQADNHTLIYRVTFFYTFGK